MPRRSAAPATQVTPKAEAQAKKMTVSAMAVLTAATVVTSLRGLPTMADEELTMFFYIGFAVILFLIPAALVAAELGGGKSVV